MFGRKKRQEADDDAELDEEATDELAQTDTDDDQDDDDQDEQELADEDLVDDDSQADEPDEDEPDEDEPTDEWLQFDQSRDWREDGPFDITEVDLDADEVQRIDFGSLIVTPFDGMKLQLQVKQDSQEVQALLVVAQQSAIEVALFSAPLRSSMLAEVRADMQAATDAAGGTMTLAKGPLGTEIRRKLPAAEATTKKKAVQPSRTWLAQGPRWLLRGVLMGPAALENDVDAGEAQLLFEFFCNLVVRRGDAPKVPGELIALDMPTSLLAELGEQPG